jgi:uncharacterized membrane protein YGL010W
MAAPLRSALALLGRYAEYHRDQRNIVTHFFGVPMVVFALGVLLAGLHGVINGVEVTAAWLAFAAVALWYLSRGHFAIGLATTLGVGGLMALAHRASQGTLGQWLALWLGCFLLGWAAQTVGHYYEGRRPDFADDRVGLLVGPMFVVLELLASLGLFKTLMADVVRHAGPTHLRDLAPPARR